MASDGHSLLGLWIEGQKNFGTALLDGATEMPELGLFKETRKWIYDYFAGKRPSAQNIPLSPEGNDFKKAVWSVISEIPYGKTETYAEVAKKVGRLTGKSKMPAQAVAAAIGHNPIMLLIPCHRVLGSDGSHTGYSAGVDKKALLLRLEGAKRIFQADENNKSDTERILTLSGTKLEFTV